MSASVRLRQSPKKAMTARLQSLGIAPKQYYNIPSPITDLLMFYTDDTQESREAQAFLEFQGIKPHVVHGGLDSGWRYPLAQFHAWDYEGLEGIHILLHQMEFYGQDFVNLGQRRVR